MTGFNAFKKITHISDTFIEEAAFDHEIVPAVILKPKQGFWASIASFFGSAAGVAVICGVISIGMITGISILGRGNSHNNPASTVDVTTTDVQDTESDAETETEAETKPCVHTESDWIVDVPAKVDVEGSRHKECVLCGEVIETETLASLVPSKGLKFTTLYNGTCYVSGIGNCKDTDVVIPLTAPNGDIVIRIGNYAFSSCETLTSIVICDNVTRIEANAFSGCLRLKSVTIGSGVVSIGNNAFEMCTLLTSIVIPDSVTKIGEGTFYQCFRMESLTIGNGVEKIGKNAFYGCNYLESITIPYAGDGTAANTYLGYIFGASYYGENSDYVPPTLKEVVITGASSIGDHAFYGCNGLRSVTISNSVTSIGKSAFWNCDGLTSIAIPDSVTRIGDYAFKECDSLTSIMIPDSVTHIGDYAFTHCNGLTSVTIGNSVTSIGVEAFYSCSKLVEVINKSALDITVGSGDCGYVAKYAKEVHDGESKIVYQDGYLFYAYDGTNYLLGYVDARQATSLVLPDDYNGEDYEIYSHAFYCCTNLKSVTIGNNVTSIGNYAFSACYGLTNVTIGDSVTSIGNRAFSGCSGVTSIEIPNSVTSIGNYAFYAWSGLTDIYYTGTKDAWAVISIDENNDVLAAATIHYNYVP